MLDPKIKQDAEIRESWEATKKKNARAVCCLARGNRSGQSVHPAPTSQSNSPNATLKPKKTRKPRSGSLRELVVAFLLKEFGYGVSYRVISDKNLVMFVFAAMIAENANAARVRF